MNQVDHQLLVQMTNGFRAWGASALLFAWPAMSAFFRFALHRAISARRSAGCQRWWCFAKGAWHAGWETNMQANAWVWIVTLLFVGMAGTGIFISSNFMGGYTTAALTVGMLPLWAMMAAAAWGVAISTATHRRSMGVAAGIMLMTCLGVALSLEGHA